MAYATRGQAQLFMESRRRREQQRSSSTDPKERKGEGNLDPDPKDIPLNPKEPWDVEMHFDDSLTPKILVDQLSDSELPLCSSTGDRAASNAAAIVVGESPPTSSAAVTVTVTVTAPPATGNAVPEPDTELLEVLLKNPEVVDALTKGEGRNLTEEQLVALLDMVKQSGTGVTGLLNRLTNSSFVWPEPEPEPVSLPSPTPPSRTDWRPEFPSPPRGAAAVPLPPSPLVMPVSTNNLKQTAWSLGPAPQAPATILSLPQLMVTANPSLQQQQLLPVLNLQPTKPPHLMYQVNHPPMQALHPGPLKPAWPPTDDFSDFSRPVQIPDYRNGHVLLDDPVTSSSNCYFDHLDNNYNGNSCNVYPRVNDYVPRGGTGTRSPEGSPAVSRESREFPYDARNYSDFDRNHKWSMQRQWNPYSGGRGGGGGRRWWDCDRGR